jgi:hypothetical protein
MGHSWWPFSHAPAVFRLSIKPPEIWVVDKPAASSSRPNRPRRLSQWRGPTRWQVHSMQSESADLAFVGPRRGTAPTELEYVYLRWCAGVRSLTLWERRCFLFLFREHAWASATFSFCIAATAHKISATHVVLADSRSESPYNLLKEAKGDGAVTGPARLLHQLVGALQKRRGHGQAKTSLIKLCMHD